MKQTQRTILMAFILCCSGSTVRAHHSYAATYYPDKIVKIEGTLAVFMYRNPHSVIQVLVSANDGSQQRWACEWAGTLTLDHGGVNSYTLKPGDHLIISGMSARNEQDHRLLVQSIERPSDHWRWSGDSTK